MKLKFEEELKKTKNKKILSFLDKITDLDKQEKEQLKLIVLWESIETFDIKKGCLFSTHLYNCCRFKFLKHINKKNIPIFKHVEVSYCDNNIFQDLPLEHEIIIKDRFVYRYTLNELCHKYSLKKDKIKELIEESKNFLKKILEK